MAHNNYVPRVTQLDAVQLDEEVIELLKSQLFETTKYFSPGVLSPVGPELELLLRSLIFKYSILKNGKTFGQQMLLLKYDLKLLSRSKIYWLFGYTVLMKYVKDRLFLTYTLNRRAQNFISILERIQIVGDFLNLIQFLQSGKNCTFIDYVLNLEMASDKRFRHQYTDYAWTRELLWNYFIELFGILTPFLKMNFIKQNIIEKILSIFRKSKNLNQKLTSVLPNINKNTKCVECKGNPILPHFMGCQHVFCQYCLEANKLENPQYKCPQCNFCGYKVMCVSSG